MGASEGAGVGRTSGRSAADTRRLVLSAARRVIGRHGVAAPLELIAERAGLSKAGVVYHFRSKDRLLSALAQEQFDAFRAEVDAQLDERDGGPGRLLRAYVRASLLPQNADELRERFALITQLLAVPTVLELARRDDELWQRELALDGVPEITRTLVLAEADGFIGAPLWTTEFPPRVRAGVRRELLAMIDRAVA